MGGSRRAQRGFTVVELLIVIVVIGVLVALVMNTFSGTQRRARDTDRAADINALSIQLEAYFNDHDGYPAAVNPDGLLDDAWITTNLKGIDIQATRAYGQSANSLRSGAATTKDEFGYEPQPAGCVSPTDASGAQQSGTTCKSYTLSWWSEDKNAIQPKQSLNQ